jgi:hypothetical protein
LLWRPVEGSGAWGRSAGASGRNILIKAGRASDHKHGNRIVLRRRPPILLCKPWPWHKEAAVGTGRAGQPEGAQAAREHVMRLVLRIVGTWLLGLALILLVIDGTKSLGANGLVLTSFAQAWTGLHEPSLAGVQSFFRSRFFAELLDGVLDALLSYPAFVVVGVPGIILVLLGRRPRRERYVSQDQI